MLVNLVIRSGDSISPDIMASIEGQRRLTTFIQNFLISPAIQVTFVPGLQLATRPPEDPIPIMNNFLAVLSKSWRFLAGSPAPANPWQVTRQTEHPQVRVIRGLDANPSVTLTLFQGPTDAAVLHATIWKIANVAAWCILPNRKKLSSPKVLSTETWKRIAIQVDPECLREESHPEPPRTPQPPITNNDEPEGVS